MNAMQVPSGKLMQGPIGLELQFERTLNHSPEPVWSAMTASSELEKWIGRWEGDPATGEVTFYMTAEGDDFEPEAVSIRECVKHQQLQIDTSVGEGAWRLRFTLRPEGNGTALMFAQVVGGDPLGNVGPGWEYYLDRLVAALAEDDVDSVDWDAYYPSMSGYYESLRESSR